MAMNSGIDRKKGEKQKDHDNNLEKRLPAVRKNERDQIRAKTRTNIWDRANEGKYPIATLDKTNPTACRENENKDRLI